MLLCNLTQANETLKQKKVSFQRTGKHIQTTKRIGKHTCTTKCNNIKPGGGDRFNKGSTLLPMKSCKVCYTCYMKYVHDFAVLCLFGLNNEPLEDSCDSIFLMEYMYKQSMHRLNNARIPFIILEMDLNWNTTKYYEATRAIHQKMLLDFMGLLLNYVLSMQTLLSSLEYQYGGALIFHFSYLFTSQKHNS